MLKKSITYTDFNGEEVTEDFFFHLSKSDLVELQFSKQGGLEAWIKNVVATEDGGQIITEFRKLLAMSYGQKTADGKRFIKNDALRAEFESSPAYDVLFMDLVTDAQAAAEFVNGIVPGNLEIEIDAMTKKAESTPAAEMAERLKDKGQGEEHDAETEALLKKENVFDESATRVLTQVDLLEMDSEELKAGLAEGRFRLS